jgi:tetratricopeptide (TPR) repeat protein
MQANPTIASLPISPATMGLTLECSPSDSQLTFPDAIRIGCDPDAVAAYADGSVHRIVSIGGLEQVVDPIQVLRAWRRVLAADGILALTPSTASTNRHTFSTSYLLSLVSLIGGFDCQVEQSNGSDGVMLFARSRAAEVRAPLAVLGPALAATASTDRSSRGELYFQFGTILLQSGDPGLARACFEHLLRHEPSSAEAHFGLGMSLAAEQRWNDALCELECARRLDPRNGELPRWINLARNHVDAQQGPALPANQPVPRFSPAAAPPSNARALVGASLRL